MEELKKVSFGLVKVLLAVILCSSLVFAGDIVHQDDVAPKKPGCENNFVLVSGNKTPNLFIVISKIFYLGFILFYFFIVLGALFWDLWT